MKAMNEGDGVDDFAPDSRIQSGITLNVDPAPAPSAAMEDVPVRKRRRAPGEAAGTRNEDDAYDTPEALALACAEWCSNLANAGTRPLLILEPCAGNGPFVKAARKTWSYSKIVAVDIRPECRESCVMAGAALDSGGGGGFHALDALTLPAGTIGAADLILTNPPFRRADELVRHFWASMKDGAVLAFLLSVTFLGSKDRWEEEPPGLFKLAPLTYMIPIVPRPDFGPTSPKFEAGLFVWVKGEGEWVAGAVIPHDPIRWVKPKRTRAKKE
jgi:hypothetical protein